MEKEIILELLKELKRIEHLSSDISIVTEHRYVEKKSNEINSICGLAVERTKQKLNLI